MNFEFEFLYFLQSLHTPWLDSFMTAVTGLGNGGGIWILTGVIFLFSKKTRDMGICLLLSLLAGLVIGNVILKNLVARSRPSWLVHFVPLLIENPTDYSFPSGHTLASFEGAVSIFLYRRKWGIFALILAAVIAFSRMYLFVHFPTDILGGMVLGTAIACGIHWLWEKKGVPLREKLCYTGKRKNK